jgi:hypothetical protein
VSDGLDAVALAAMCDPTVADKFLWGAEERALRDRLRRWDVELEQCVMFQARVQGVEKVKTENGWPGKARLTLSTLDRQGRPETIETDWLVNPTLQIARVAQANRGENALLWKTNDEDPTGTVTQGYRRLVWLVILPGGDTPAGAPQRAHNGQRGREGQPLRSVS